MATVNLQKNPVTKHKSVNYEIIGGRKNVIRKENQIFKTPSRAQIGHQTSILPSLDDLPMIDRSLIDYTKYHKYVGHAGRKYSMAMQATRGCPYRCTYCEIGDLYFQKIKPQSIEKLKKEFNWMSENKVVYIDNADSNFGLYADRDLEIAKTYFHLSQQHRSAWTHELDLRAFSDLAWWNHATMLDE